MRQKDWLKRMRRVFHGAVLWSMIAGMTQFAFAQEAFLKYLYLSDCNECRLIDEDNLNFQFTYFLYDRSKSE